MKYSILDLAYLREGQTYKEAFDDMIVLGKKAEELGFERYWIAEHHNSKNIGSSATQLLIQRLLANTNEIRVGSGGVMLANHSPYLVAEQYGTLETLYPGRLDLGLGRAPGTDMVTARALRRTNNLYTDFEAELAELRSYFDGTSHVKAYPALGINIPMYILGSSTDSAHLAAKLGLPYAFAAHFAPRYMEQAVSIYRREFKPSSSLKEPYVILCANVIAADTNEEAGMLSTSHKQAVLGLITGETKGILPPKNSEEELWKDYIKSKKVPHFGPIAFQLEDIINREKEIVKQMTAVSLIGDKESISRQLIELKKYVDFDEIMVNSIIYDIEVEKKSLKLFSEVIWDKGDV